MKTITINVSESVYEDFRYASKHADRPTSELIREAMAQYHRQYLQPRSNLRGFRPHSAGKVIKDLSRDDDLLSEMLDPET